MWSFVASLAPIDNGLGIAFMRDLGIHERSGAHYSRLVRVAIRAAVCTSGLSSVTVPVIDAQPGLVDCTEVRRVTETDVRVRTGSVAIGGRRGPGRSKVR